MQARQGACANTHRCEALGVPRLPGLGDVMVPHIGRIADEGSRSSASRQRQLAVVLDVDSRTARPATNSQIGSQHQRRKGVKLHRHKLRLREGLAGGQDEATRPCAWVNDARGRTLAGEPGHHRLDDGGRRVDRTGTAPGERRTHQREGVAKGIKPFDDRAPGRLHQGGREHMSSRLCDQGALGRRQPLGSTNQGNTESDQFRLTANASGKPLARDTVRGHQAPSPLTSFLFMRFPRSVCSAAQRRNACRWSCATHRSLSRVPPRWYWGRSAGS